MASYVLMAFDNDAQAQRFVEKINGRFGIADSIERAFRVVGLYRKPTKFCQCESGEKGARPFTRGPKYGWWICTQCGRPTEGWGKSHNHWASAIGTNLLPGNKDYIPKGYGVMRPGDPAPVPTGSSTPPDLEKREKRDERRARRVRH